MDVRRLARNAAISQAMRAWHQKTQTTRDGRPMWSERENDILRKHYPDFRKLYELLPHQTIGAIDNQCVRLELVTKRTLWTKVEFSKLRKMYGSVSNVVSVFIKPYFRTIFSRRAAEHWR